MFWPRSLAVSALANDWPLQLRGVPMARCPPLTAPQHPSKSRSSARPSAARPAAPRRTTLRVRSWRLAAPDRRIARRVDTQDRWPFLAKAGANPCVPPEAGNKRSRRPCAPHRFRQPTDLAIWLASEKPHSSQTWPNLAKTGAPAETTFHVKRGLRGSPLRHHHGASAARAPAPEDGLARGAPLSARICLFRGGTGRLQPKAGFDPVPGLQ